MALKRKKLGRCCATWSGVFWSEPGRKTDERKLPVWKRLLSKRKFLSRKYKNCRRRMKINAGFKSQALSIAWVVGQTRWLQFAQQAVSISMPLLVTLVFWLIAIFVSFGLFAPRNTAVVVCMFISAASVSGAILMILEMYSPYRGLMQLSGAPLRAAFTQLGR